MSREKCQQIIRDLEKKYLRSTSHIPYDKYFRMIYNGMTKQEEKMYKKAKMTLLEQTHGLSAL